MEQVRLGATGLRVSRVALGCMSFGDPGRGQHAWTLPEADSRPLIAQALELGVTFFDTANAYSDGSSEEIVGRALRDFARREDVVIATKVFMRMRPGPNGAGLSRAAILHEVDASLRRLGTDHIDLYQIHRCDPGTPIEETMEALHDVVRAGKVRYLGASSMWAWQFARMNAIAERHGWTRFVSMQDHYNLLYREEEREMLPLCAADGHRRAAVEPAGPRAADPRPGTARPPARRPTSSARRSTPSGDREIVERVAQVAQDRGVPRAQVALAWLLARPGRDRADRRRHHAVAPARTRWRRSSLELSAEEVALLEQPYRPHEVAGFA